MASNGYASNYERPDWSEWVQWEPNPHTYRALVADRSLVPSHKGFYAFGLDPNALRPGRVLYIGKTEGQGGFRERFGFYLKADPTQKSSRKHKAALFLQDHRLFMNALDIGDMLAQWQALPEQHSLFSVNTQDLGAVWVWFAPFESADAQWIRLTEAAMMQYYDAWYNSASMRSKTPYDTVAIRK